jgi:hypothetical protein
MSWKFLPCCQGLQCARPPGFLPVKTQPWTKVWAWEPRTPAPVATTYLRKSPGALGSQQGRWPGNKGKPQVFSQSVTKEQVAFYSLPRGADFSLFKFRAQMGPGGVLSTLVQVNVNGDSHEKWSLSLVFPRLTPSLTMVLPKKVFPLPSSLVSGQRIGGGSNRSVLNVRWNVLVITVCDLALYFSRWKRK